jgi:hypothetical protein
VISLIIVLRLIHVILGALWLGTVFFTTVYLVPAVGDAGPAGGKVMEAMQKRGIMTVMPMVAIGTLLTGVALYWIVSDGFNPQYVHSRMGATFATGGVLAIVAWLLGIFVMRPAMLRSGSLGQKLASTTSETERATLASELARLRARGSLAGKTVVMLVMLAASAMAVARYI